MDDVVSYVCVRADHQWATADAGRVHPKDGGLAWCPDASLEPNDRHEWRACDQAPLTMATSLAAQVGAMESAVS
jgi:hypothetical protein